MAIYNVENVYYINQGTEPFASLKLKDNTTVQEYGCGVCAYGMLICQKEGYDTSSEAKQVVVDLIQECTNNSGLIDTRFSDKTINGVTYSVTEVNDMAQQIMDGIPVVARFADANNKAKHFVTVVGLDTSKSGMEAYIIKDPSKRANSNLQEALNDYSGTSVRGKFIIS